MATTHARAASARGNSSLLRRHASLFFGRLEKSEHGRELLKEQDHRIVFEIENGRSFHVDVASGKIKVHDGAVEPRRYDADDVIHFRLSSSTLEKLFGGTIRFTDALIPTDPEGRDAMLLLECTLFKWSVLSWVGRLFRTAQLSGDSSR
jgi:hypothetical protein